MRKVSQQLALNINTGKPEKIVMHIAKLSDDDVTPMEISMTNKVLKSVANSGLFPDSIVFSAGSSDS